MADGLDALSLISAIDILRTRADSTALVLLDHTAYREISNLELLIEASRTATVFHEQGISAGDNVTIIASTSDTSIFSIFGAWLLGAATSIMAPAPPRAGAAHWEGQILGMLGVAQPGLILTAGDSLPLAESAIDRYRRRNPRARVLTMEALRAATSGSKTQSTHSACPHPEGTAHLQFTSGTTGKPKGIEISHSQIVSNATSIGNRVGVESGDSMLSWLPLHHDMGFIGGLMCPIVWGLPGYLLTPEKFARNPLTWLQSISKVRATLSPAPSSAYRLLANGRVSRKSQQFDLTCWRYGWVGAETRIPVHHSKPSRRNLHPMD